MSDKDDTILIDEMFDNPRLASKETEAYYDEIFKHMREEASDERYDEKRRKEEDEVVEYCEKIGCSLYIE